MKNYISIDKRVNDYRKDSITIDFSKAEKSSTEFLEKQYPYIAQNRTLDNQFRMMLSIYRKDGVESAYYGEKRFCYQHELPFTGVLHKHEFIEIFYVIDGSFEQILLGEHHFFKKGEFVITDQNCEHSDYLIPVDASVMFLMISSDYLDELLHCYDEKDELQRFLFHALNRQKREQSFLKLKEMNDGREQSLRILEQLFEEMIGNELGTNEVRKGLLIRLLRHLCVNYRPILNSDTQEGKEKATLYEVERYIRIHLADVTSSTLEETFHYHRNYYNLLLQKYRGTTFKKYLLDIRLRKADELFRTTVYSIKDIIRSVGYENTSHFYHLYEKKYGHAPRENREYS